LAAPSPPSNPKHRWDRGVDYHEAKNLIVAQLQQDRSECLPDALGGEDPFAPVRIAYSTVALVQLCNGSRASEALDAVGMWARQAPQREFNVRVRKYRPRCACGHKKLGKQGHEVNRGKCKFAAKSGEPCPCLSYRPDPEDVELRPLGIPEQCVPADAAWVIKAIDAGHFTEHGYTDYVRRTFGWNSHSLRYSKVSRLVKDGKTAEQIASMTHHKNAAIIRDYTSDEVGLRLMRETLNS
jgi:hypothetical protein